MVHERPGHGDALFLAAREFVGLVAGPVLQSHEGEQFRGPFLGSLGAGAGDIGRNHDVLDSGKLRQQLVELEDEAQFTVSELREFLAVEQSRFGSVDDHVSAVGLVKCTHDLQQGGFARSAGAYDTHDVPLVDMQVDALEHL